MSTELINIRTTPDKESISESYHAKRSNISPETRAKQNLFLEQYVIEGTISHAARKLKMSTNLHYDWLNSDPTYPERFKAAYRECAEMLEREARRRAIEGVNEPIGWYRGEPGGFVTKYSDVLLIFLLKGAMPDKYKDRIDHSGRVEIDNSPIPLDKLSLVLKQLIVLELTGGSLSEGLMQQIQTELSTKDALEMELVTDVKNGEENTREEKVIDVQRSDETQREVTPLTKRPVVGQLKNKLGWGDV